MKYLKQIASGLFCDEHGVSATEYAIMLAIIVLVCVASIRLLGENSQATFQFVADVLGS